MKVTKADMKKTVLGWREWALLPDLKVKRIKVKIDTGARTSALHVSNMVFYRKGRYEYVEFLIHPTQRKQRPVIKARAKVVEFRLVKSSNGQVSVRPVIKTRVKIADKEFEIELTLVNRDLMGFRMLLGRQALKNFLIVPTKSFLQGS
ncbi:MAG: RimK/LysX family protein [Bdellovibrionaceae bacterium]|nr:RimK/LysX family protein [Pseudobdellovibrionaceae bacterium]